MKQQGEKTLWTIGHSTRTIEDLIVMLRAFEVELLTDIRSYPRSRRYPHFNKDALEAFLPQNNIAYLHFKELGSRRKTNVNSVNTGWKHPAFRGHADYMETASFKESAAELEDVAVSKLTAIMCSEALCGDATGL